jgi:porin
LALLAIAGGAKAQDQGKPAADYATETLTGDRGGRRAAWLDSGMDWQFGLKSDWLRNRGGLADGGRPMNQFDIKLNADLAKLWGWSSTKAFVHFLYDWGDRINVHHVGSIIGVSNIEWPIDTTRFFHAWVERSLLGDTLGVLVGLYPFDSEFSALESGAVFLHPSLGASPDVSLTRGPSIFNNSAFGARVKWRPDDSPLYVQAALLDGIPGDPAQPKGTHIKFAKGDGSFHVLELGFTPNSEDGQGERFAKAAIGSWGYTAKVDDLTDLNADGSPAKRRSSGWYVLAEQTVWRDARVGERNLAAFARFCATDGNSTAINRALNLGLRLRAPIRRRTDDVAGIAITRANIDDKLRRLRAASGIDATADESALELTYRAAITKWLTVQPVVQRIRHPGAVAGAATVFGARFEIAL